MTSYDPADRDLANDSADNNKTTEAKYKYDWAKQSFLDAGVRNAEEYEEWAKGVFTSQPAQMKLLIVVNKLLTGFDAPSLPSYTSIVKSRITRCSRPFAASIDSVKILRIKTAM